MNLPRINQNWLLLLVALLLGGGAAFLGNRMVQRHMQALDEEARRANQPIAVVVAKRDLSPGDALTADNFAVRQVPREFVNADALTPEAFSQLEYQRLAVGMKRGDMLLPVHAEGAGTTVFSATLKNGRRAMTFEVDTVNSVSGMLRPGDRIDLMLSQRSSGDSQEEVTRTLLSNMVVLATDQNLKRRDERTGQEHSFSTVTLDLSPQDAQRLIVAKQAGRLTALLRHPDDQAPNPTHALTAAGLFGSQRGAISGQPLQVEYIVGGGGGPASVQKQVVEALGRALTPAGLAAAPAAGPVPRTNAPAFTPPVINPGALPPSGAATKSAALP
ncbi:Flp pilus assembly protein CpaB [Roseateles sp.]|uniref:Flp pilus assembly protein CpaB n=1 Tax=Roseateles sp. TaxID=1971397 RepID=UPI002E000770|nr:Flp pilus assembly protein CpaB [Roseateles sp.]